VAVLSQLYVDVIARGFADVNAQVRSLMASMRQANALSNQMQQATARMGSGGSGGMGQMAASAGLMSRAMAALGPAAVVAGTALAAMYAGIQLVKQGLQGTVQLERLTQMNQAFARSVSGVFTPAVDAMSRAWLNLTNAFNNSPNLRAGIYLGLVVPITIFVKLLESAVKLIFAIADGMMRVAGAVARGLGQNVAFNRFMDAAAQKRDVTLNQTGTESGEGTFQRIQQAILKLSVPEEESPLEAALKQIGEKVDAAALAIKMGAAGIEQAINNMKPKQAVDLAVGGGNAALANIRDNPLGVLRGVLGL
jgi:hypothetical protein